MTNQDKIADYFSLFHDGTIIDFFKEKNDLILTIDCQFLAELINPEFKRFFIKLNSIESIEFKTWPRDLNTKPKILKNLTDIFHGNLEINSAEPLTDNEVQIECIQYDTSMEFSGGHLKINCKNIQIFDEKNNELSEDKLDWLQKNYWESI